MSSDRKGWGGTPYHKWDMTPTNSVLSEGCVEDYLCAKLHLIDLASSK